MRAAIYCRVSTPDQHIEMQLEALRKYAAAREWETVEYIDHGVSGAKESRPGLNALMEDARKRKFGAVLVWRLDRYGRSLRHLVLSIDEFRDLGIVFVSYSEGFDLSSPTGRLMAQQLGAFAEFERALIRERVKAGVSRAIAAGKQWGRKPQSVDLSQVPAGTSIRAASALLGIGRETVRRAMKRNTVQHEETL